MRNWYAKLKGDAEVHCAMAFQMRNSECVMRNWYAKLRGDAEVHCAMAFQMRNA